LCQAIFRSARAFKHFCGRVYAGSTRRRTFSDPFTGAFEQFFFRLEVLLLELLRLLELAVLKLVLLELVLLVFELLDLMVFELDLLVFEILQLVL
jgi:hypothetical protein